MTVQRPAWPCEAYGETGLDVGAWCFVSPESQTRLCSSVEHCRAQVRAARQQTFQRISELAAAGDALGADLAEAFPDPSMLLGGGSGDEGDG